MSRSLLTNETSELDLLDQRPFDQSDFDILEILRSGGGRVSDAHWLPL